MSSFALQFNARFLISGIPIYFEPALMLSLCIIDIEFFQK